LDFRFWIERSVIAHLHRTNPKSKIGNPKWLRVRIHGVTHTVAEQVERHHRDAQTIQAVISYPWLLIPVLCLIIAVMAFNLLGDGVRDAVDPYA
jgi:hypothetical protein